MAEVNRKDENHEKQIGKCDDPSFKWEKLPLEVYEVLVKYLDGLGLMNLCLSSACMTEHVLEPFISHSVQKREDHWRNFCIENLDPSLACKIFSSYVGADDLNHEFQQISQEEARNRNLCLVSWEDVFQAHLFYWNCLVLGRAVNQRLFKLENKLKAEMICSNAAFVPVNEFHTNNIPYTCMIRSGAGKVILNVIRPAPCVDSDSTHINMVVTEVSGSGGNVDYKHLSSICSNAEEFFELKIVYFPRMRNVNGSNFMYVDQVVISVCSECITTAPLLGGVTRKMAWTEAQRTDDDNLNVIESCPVFEVHENVVVMWPLPESLIFFLMVAAPDQEGYEFFILYRLQFDGMDDVWKRIVEFPSHYLAIVDEYKGHALANEQARNILMGRSGYCYRPTTVQPVNYGLTLTSPIFDTISLRPTVSADNMGTTVETWKPLYLRKNAGMRHGMREPTCSAKGYGLFVFCSNTTIAASWDSQLWTHGTLMFPFHIQTSAQNRVTHVQVINYNNGLLLVVNEDIVLVEIDFKRDEELGPHVEVKPMRVFLTTLASLCKEITQIELNFDAGNPFFLIVAKRKSKMQKAIPEGAAIPVRDEFSLAILRIDFEF